MARLRSKIERPRYPTSGGMPVPIDEVFLPQTSLADEPYNRNNHHYFFPHRLYLGAFVYEILRELELSQVQIPKDMHNMGKLSLHALYRPPEMPRPQQAITRVLEAFENGELLRRGIANNPFFTVLTKEMVERALAEYTQAHNVYRAYRGE